MKRRYQVLRVERVKFGFHTIDECHDWVMSTTLDGEFQCARYTDLNGHRSWAAYLIYPIGDTCNTMKEIDDCIQDWMRATCDHDTGPDDRVTFKIRIR